MKETDFEGILEAVKVYDENGIHWHYHFLSPRCLFNETEDFHILLDNEDTNDIFIAKFIDEPSEEIKILDDLFQKKNK